MKNTNEYKNQFDDFADFEIEADFEKPVYYVPKITFKNKRKKEKTKENKRN